MRTGGFQVQIEAKASFTSVGPHIKYTEAGLQSKLRHLNSTEENNSYKCHSYILACKDETE